MSTQRGIFLGFGVPDKPSNIARLCYSQLWISETRILLTKAKSISQLLQIFMDRHYRLIASLQNQEDKIQSNIPENIFESADH